MRNQTYIPDFDLMFENLNLRLRNQTYVSHFKPTFEKSNLKVEYPYIVRKSEKSLSMGEFTSMPRKLHVADCSRKPKYMFSFSVANYSKTAQKTLNKGCSAWNQTISLGITSSDA